ncbi:ATP-binding protein [Rhizobium sp. BK376]|uniref:ATP-binding protein n=1 Tax=Rhizobium sp. BK376 TaxID=2512149 RepID=UPI00104AEACB|nr:ATP-binding protein [Rhizobium sp. BK376]TCR76726.1 signal transduction histidine kinase [Rhizobium sp. BK376]
MVRRLTLFGRLVFAMSVVALVATCASAAFLYIRFQAANDEFREETLSTFAKELGRQIASDPTLSDIHAIALKSRIHELRGEFAVIRTDGSLLEGSGEKGEPLIPTSGDQTQFFLLPSHDKIKALFGLSLKLGGGGRFAFVQVAFPREHVIFDSVLEEFVTDIAWIWIPFVLVLLLTNVIVLKLALKPLTVAAQEARAITPSSIAKRLTETRMPDDVLSLVRAVNEALERLQTGFLSLEQFSGLVAHELRTPLAIVKTRLSLSQDRIAREVESDLAGIERLINQLIDRVRIGALHYEQEDLVDLVDVARQVGRFLAPTIFSAGCDIEVAAIAETVTVSGAFDFIFRALRNLVENALHHSSVGGMISIRVYQSGIVVIDQGAGFPPSRLSQRHDARVESDRADGLGLGLSIVAETMAAHGGRLKLSNLPAGGASAAMEFPFQQSGAG